jgi:hypothetical protein
LFSPPTHLAATHFGHGDAELPVRYTRDASGIFTLLVPVVMSPVPPASVAMTLTTQVLSGPFRMGSGPAKKQLGSSPQEPTFPPHWESRVHAVPKFVPPMQCEVGPAPLVQFRLLVPLLATRLGPEMSKILVAWSGVAPGGTLVAPPPPM